LLDSEGRRGSVVISRFERHCHSNFFSVLHMMFCFIEKLFKLITQLIMLEIVERLLVKFYPSALKREYL
jgi:hypothetical protein